MTAAARSFLEFDERWVVVTGASSGLGRACAVELSAHGARVVLVGRDERRLQETRAQMTGRDHRTLRLDLAQLDCVAPAILHVAEEVGPLYGLCHAAGVVTTTPLARNTVDVMRSMMTVNVFAGLELARMVARRDVMTGDGGSLVFLSSIYGRVGAAGEVSYSASKGALAAAVRAMAVELARRRVRVNSISPGLIRTSMTDTALAALSEEQVTALEAKHLLGLGTAADVARAAVFLLAPATSWITGTDLVVDGGYSAH